MSGHRLRAQAVRRRSHRRVPGLTYEQTCDMLDGLLGEQVAVLVGQPGARVAAAVGFTGVLQYADPIPVAGLRDDVGSRNARFYFVGDAAGDPTWFLIQEAGFRGGRIAIDSDDDTSIHIHTDALRFTVTGPAADAGAE